MPVQKSAEAIVGAGTGRRAEHERTRVGDGISIAEFKDHLKQHWPTIKAKPLAGEYILQPVRRVDIPKPQGGVRTLGIPTLADRMIQQALHQVLSPIFEADFSASSYGFRPGKSAHQAVKAAKQHVADGRRIVVDMDLEKFFDRVNHDLLMAQLANKIGDWQVLRLIRRYLQAGVMADGIVSPRTEGTSQGGPLSPLLSNILLTETKRVLEELDGWIRRKLRCILWRQWKRPYTRAMNLMKAGRIEERAWRSACNQRGPWWNSGASHMNQAFPKSYFDRLGLVSLLDTTRRLQCLS